MRRFLSLLLIPFFVLGQAPPHSHTGSGVAESKDHAARPHLHLPGFGHEHGHDHQHGHDHEDHDDHHGHDHEDSMDHEHDHGDDPSHGQSDGSRAVSQPCRIAAVPDHDCDAIYFAASAQSVTRGSVALPIDVPVADRLSGWERLGVAARSPCRINEPPDQFAGLPIYLLTASLRL